MQNEECRMATLRVIARNEAIQFVESMNEF